MLKPSDVIAVARACIFLDEGELISLEYYLRCYTSPIGATMYGVRIDKRYPEGNLIERDETAALSASFADMLELVKTFAKGTVMPSTLHDMVEEWFCPITRKLALAY